MNAPDQAGRFSSLIDLLLARGYSMRVHFADEPGRLPGSAVTPVMDGARLSVCLSASARYVVLRQGKRAEVELKKGEVIHAAPQCAMEPHPAARYLSFGLVFHPTLTRFLLARKRAAEGPGFSHRFLLVHHSPVAMDAEGFGFLAALERCAGRVSDERYVRRLLELVLLKARTSLHETRGSGMTEGKAWFAWRAACQFLQEHMQEAIGRDDVARFLHLHPNHVSRLFSQCGGVSFHRHLMNLRMERARRLLENPAVNVAEVARAVGFVDANYFVRCYRKLHGVPPGSRRPTSSC